SERVAVLFDALADLEPREARARLERECADQPALRDAVAALLEHDKAATRGFLAAQPAVLAEALRDSALQTLTAPESPQALADLPAGSSRLGRYFVLHKLGEGG